MMLSRKDLLCSLVGRVETFSFIPLFPLCNLWQGGSCCSAPARDSPDLLESPAEWVLEGLGKVGSRLASPTAALAVSLPGSRTCRLHLSQPKNSGCRLNPCLMLPFAWCSPTIFSFSAISPEKHPLCPTPVLEV